MITSEKKVQGNTHLGKHLTFLPRVLHFRQIEERSESFTLVASECSIIVVKIEAEIH